MERLEGGEGEENEKENSREGGSTEGLVHPGVALSPILAVAGLPSDLAERQGEAGASFEDLIADEVGLAGIDTVAEGEEGEREEEKEKKETELKETAEQENYEERENVKEQENK